MTKQEIIKKLNAIDEDSDQELEHMNADDFLIHFLKQNGHQDLAKAYEEAKDRCRFWYA